MTRVTAAMPAALIAALAAYVAVPGSAIARLSGSFAGRHRSGVFESPERVASWVRARKERRPSAQRRRVTDLCSALAAELRAGAPPLLAVQRVTAEVPGCADSAGAEARLGGDVASGLRRAAEQPGASGLRQLAACWELSQRTGAALAPLCEGVAAGLRADESVRAEVAAQLASARASARLMGVLPVLALGFGSAIGADPFAVLFGTSYGVVCLTVGGLLAALGIVWVERLARVAESDS